VFDRSRPRRSPRLSRRRIWASSRRRSRRPVSFGRSLRDPDVERPRPREVGSGRLAASLARSRPKYADLLGRPKVASAPRACADSTGAPLPAGEEANVREDGRRG
jgi:hypothetical protein